MSNTDEDSVIERSETADTPGQVATVADPAAQRGLHTEATPVSTVKPNVFPGDGVQLPTKESSSAPIDHSVEDERLPDGRCSCELGHEPFSVTHTGTPKQLKIDGETPVEEPKGPRRVQYHRGDILDKNTVYVGRRSPWGNIFRMDIEGDRDRVIALFRAELKARLRRQPNLLEPLRGKNLACWCPLHKKCHADVYLELAN